VGEKSKREQDFNTEGTEARGTEARGTEDTEKTGMSFEKGVDRDLRAIAAIKMKPAWLRDSHPGRSN
jgi:hypothetical protein